MNSKYFILFILLMLSAPVFSQYDQDNISILQGSWTGKLQGLRIIFNLKLTDDTLIITMDSPDQGVMDIPVNGYSFDQSKVVFTVDVISGRYDGIYDAENEVIEGTWRQHGYELPLDLERLQEAPEGPVRPQEPQPPFPYLAEEVLFENTIDKIKLSGTLTLPEGNGPFPAVLLVSGSGPQNRDEEIMGHKPFGVIADDLTRAGVAVLRYDDRGFGKSTGDYTMATTLDFADDARAALAFLKKDQRINQDKIGIIGHSEGAMIAPMVASTDPAVAFIVMLAGPGLTGRETINLQNQMLLKEYGESQDYITRVMNLNNKIFDIVVKVQDDEKAAAKIRKAFDKFTSGMSAQEKQQRGMNDFIVEKTIKDMLTPWMRSFLDLDIKPYLAGTRCPVLVHNGAKDIQVDPQENIPPIEKTLKESGNPDYRIEILPGLNHLFQTSLTGLPSEYGSIEETFSPVALEMIREWILKFK